MPTRVEYWVLTRNLETGKVVSMYRDPAMDKVDPEGAIVAAIREARTEARD